VRRREEQVNACAKRRLCRRKELAFSQRKVRLTPRNKDFSLRKQLFAWPKATLCDGYAVTSRCAAALFVAQQLFATAKLSLRAAQQHFAAAMRPNQEGKCIHSSITAN